MNIKTTDDYEPVLAPYGDKPVADKKWLANYREKRQTYAEDLKELQRGLHGIEKLNTW